MAQITRAISIRQPYAELILTGDKEYEFRSWPTKIRERVYIYAGLKPADDPMPWFRLSMRPDGLPTGQIIGTVEIAECEWYDARQCYAFELRKPKRLRKALKPRNQPQPGFWRPKF